MRPSQRRAPGQQARRGRTEREETSHPLRPQLGDPRPRWRTGKMLVVGVDGEGCLHEVAAPVNHGVRPVGQYYSF